MLHLDQNILPSLMGQYILKYIMKMSGHLSLN